VGGLVAGPIADRVDCKFVLVGAVLLFGAAHVWSALSASLGELTVLRFVTGLGLGAAMPNAVTLIGEFCPDGRRATLTNMMFCGFPLGPALGGFLAACPWYWRWSCWSVCPSRCVIWRPAMRRSNGCAQYCDAFRLLPTRHHRSSSSKARRRPVRASSRCASA